MTFSNLNSYLRLTYRDAVADCDEISSRLSACGLTDEEPLVTIAIPTFQRSDLLIEAVKSALRQDWPRQFEIVVVDNDPSSVNAQTLIDRLPELRQKNFRYFVNEHNIGAFPNWNRCLRVARGEWVTLLNDDDLLDPNCLSTLFSAIDRDPAVDGITSRLRWLDERPGAVQAQPTIRDAIRAFSGRLLRSYQFGGKDARKIRSRRLFWGPIGNSGGFIFRRSAALAIGGFYPEEHPSSDYWFYARFAAKYNLRQHREQVINIRKTGNNITASTVLEQLKEGYKLQTALVNSGEVPGWWRIFIPYLAACHRAEFEQTWDSRVSKANLEDVLGTSLPGNHPRFIDVARLLFRGF
jgi:glycosyltransferase involved in cell wall biosynthesis